MVRKILKAGFAISALSVAVMQSTQAAELRFDGFASFVAGQVLDKDELAGSDFRGYDSKLGFQNNSLFALQVRADLQDRLTATAQIISKGQDDYDTKFNWAYLSYQLTDELTVNVGRVRHPLFIYSQYLDVGYAYHWISPPDSVYNMGSFDSGDGVMLQHTADFSGWTSTSSVVISRSRINSQGMTVDSADGWTLAWDLNRDWFTFHAVYSNSEVTMTGQLDALGDGLSRAGISQSAINNMLMDSDEASFAGVGIALDNGTWFASAEYSVVKTKDTFTADPSKRGYISAGFRTGDWTAYATVEHMKAEYNRKSLAAISDPLTTSVNGLVYLQNNVPSGFWPAGVTPDNIDMQIMGLNQLNDAVTRLFDMNERDENIYSIGVRYNFHPSAAAKFEYIQKDDKYRDVEPAVIAAAIDLVF